MDGAETVKFLQDVLDALFAMFSTDDGNSTQHSGHVFQALVSGRGFPGGHSLVYELFVMLALLYKLWHYLIL